MFSPDSGKVYYGRGNYINQKEPNWKSEKIPKNKKVKEKIKISENRISMRKKVAELVSTNLDPKKINIFIDNNFYLTDDEKMDLKRYAKVGQILRLRD